MTHVKIWVVPAEGGSKGLVRGADAVLKEFDPDALNAALSTLLVDIDKMMKGIKTTNVHLKEFEVGFEVTAQGGINLIGTLTAGAKAAIKLKFEVV